MDFRDKEFLDRLMHLSEENNKMLHRLQRGMRISRYLRILYFIIIIGVSIGAFYYLQPVVDGFLAFLGLEGGSLKEFFTSYGTPY